MRGQSASAIDAKDHTILLIQATADRASCTYYDFDSLKGTFDGVIRMFEERLARTRHSRSLEYTADQLFDYIRSLHDISCLVLNRNERSYIPHDRTWFMETLTTYLKRELLQK